MISIRAFRSNPHFAELFAHVHVICWPILWWQLNALYLWCRRAGIPDVLYSVNAWGFISVRYAGAAPDPTRYTRPARTFRPLTDPAWASATPVCLLEEEDAEGHACLAAGARIAPRGMTEMAFIPEYNTS